MPSLHGKHILIGITGGIAAYKAPFIIRQLKALGAEIRVVVSEAATQFVTPLTLQTLSGNPVHTELFDATQESTMGHIELARWADLVLIAPATANCIACLANGHANDLLSTLCLATEAPIFIAPAMNRIMWKNKATQFNIQQLIDRDVHVLPIGLGEQACGEVGEGRMIEPEEIITHLEQDFTAGLLHGKRIMITAGPTHEYIDPVRYISNPSTGKMGYAIAQAAMKMGADVTLISGPTRLTAPNGIKIIRVTTALEMHHAVIHDVHHQHIFISTAAVSDYRTETTATQKIKKSNIPLSITLTPNPDILKTVSTLPNRPFCVGFAAETEDVLKNAAKKLASKNLDMICVNDVTDPTIGFGSDENAVTIITRTRELHLPKQSKFRLAETILTMISQNTQILQEHIMI